MLMLFVLSDKTWTAVKPGAWLVRAPPRCQQSQDMSPILSMVPQVLHSQQAVRAVRDRPVSRQRQRPALLCL